MNTIEEFRAALDYPSPAAVADPAAIIARGRRRRATRRTAGAALAMFAVAANAALVTTHLPAHSPGGPAPAPVIDAGAAGAAPNAVLVAAMYPLGVSPPTTAPDRFDPGVRTLRVGWIPGGLGTQRAEIEPGLQVYAAASGDGTRALAVVVLPRGRAVSGLGSGQIGMPLDASSAVARATDPIAGRPAQCLSDPAVPGSCSVIQWQYAPDAWARASYAGGAGTTTEEANAIARRIAESVSLTAGDSVRLPFRLTGELAARRVARTFASVDDTGSGLGFWQASVSLVDSEADLAAPAGTRPELTIALERPDPAADPGHTANQTPTTTVGGHPAWQGDGGASLVVWVDPAIRLYVGYFLRGGDALAASAEVHPIAAPDDAASWIPSR